MMKNKQLGLITFWCFFILLTFTSISARGADVYFSGVLIRNPPCDISGGDGVGQPIKVLFGEVGISRINGDNYQKNFTIKVSCAEGLGNGVSLYLRYIAIPAPFDKNVLQASQKGLGIKLLSEGDVIEPNTNITMVLSSNSTMSKTFSAVPVKDNSSLTTLTAGYFTATAAFEISYP